MKKIYKVLITLFVGICILSSVSAVSEFTSYPKANRLYDEILKVQGNFNGTSNNNNAMELISAQSLISQNIGAVEDFINSIQGSEYSQLRDYIGINEDGSIKNGAQIVTAMYMIASIIDANNHFYTNSVNTDCTDDADTYVKKHLKGEVTATGNTDGFIMHRRIAANVGDGSDEYTWKKLQEINGEPLTQLKSYYNNSVKVSTGSEEWAQYCTDPADGSAMYGDKKNYAKYDKDAKVVGGISISTGDGEDATGDTTNSAQRDGMDDIANNSVASNSNNNINQNVEDSTGVNMGDYILTYISNSKSKNKPMFTLETLMQRIKRKQGDDLTTGKNSGFYTELKAIIEDDMVGLVAMIGRYIIYIMLLFYGVRCIWDGVEGKTKFKEILPYILCALVFFFAAPGMVEIAKSAFQLEGNENYGQNLFSTIVYFVRIFAFAGIIFTGIKIMFASAEAKADVKSHMLPIIVGCIFVFASSLIVDLVVDVMKESGVKTEISSVEINKQRVNS